MDPRCGKIVYLIVLTVAAFNMGMSLERLDSGEETNLSVVIVVTTASLSAWCLYILIRGLVKPDA
jgi:hypothetical protein